MCVRTVWGARPVGAFMITVDFHIRRYTAYALLAAVLFSISTPVAKLLLDGASPLLLAGLLYLGQGVGLLIFMLGRECFLITRKLRERVLQGTEYFWLAGSVMTGGVLAPVLLFWGLSGTPASEASLLLNFEGVLTTLVAAVLFREAVGRRIWTASFIMLAGGMLLAYDPHADLKVSFGALAVIGACLMWAMDNNLTRNISAGDPVFIAVIKGLVAGGVNMGLGYAAGGSLPLHWAGAMVLGLLSYGVSLVLFIYALRHLGTARAGIYFSVAPFLGAGVSLFLPDESISATFVVAFILMLVAARQVFGERHKHEHAHEYFEHAHLHDHDSHHQHTHPDGKERSHSHLHAHEPLIHDHAHVPDIHHRHPHKR